MKTKTTAESSEPGLEALNKALEGEEPRVRPVTGPDAEDIRSANRGLTSIRMQISEMVILQDVYSKQIDEINKKFVDAQKKQEEFLGDFSKKSAELQKSVETSFAKLGLDIKDGWKFDLDKCTFFKE